MRFSLIRSLMFALVMLSVSAASSGQVFLSVTIGPPPLPVYEQPICPGEDYIWVPGYWAWTRAGYYWVPATWVLAPEPGLLWTPGYWAYESEAYYWHPGYWGPVVGYYGGIAYGYGYSGTGYYGGYWRDRHFFYNQTVNHVDVTRVHYVYRAAVVEDPPAVIRVSYNGGPDGTRARPTAEQQAAVRVRHVAPTSVQVQHEHAASINRSLLAAQNQGRPPIAATAKPAEFSGRGVVAASAGAPTAPENRAAPARPSTPAPQPENRPETRGSRPQTEQGTTPAPRDEERRQPSASGRQKAPRPENPENRPEPKASRPQTEERTTPAPRAEEPRQPSASGRQNAPRPENVPHSERQTKPEKAPKSKPPAKKDDHSDKKTPPPSGEEEHRR